MVWARENSKVAVNTLMNVRVPENTRELLGQVSAPCRYFVGKQFLDKFAIFFRSVVPVER